MFHVFYLNNGCMYVLNPPILGTVYNLQEKVYESTGVQTNDQVLLRSGGEPLSPEHRLSEYVGVGTDTNPIYLIRRQTLSDAISTQEQEAVDSLLQRFNERAHSLDNSPPNTQLVNYYTELAKNGLETADTITKFCAKIVGEHHYLNQGWLAVISNLDDNITRISKRYDRASEKSQKLITMREKGLELLQDFGDVLDTLKKIIMPSGLISTFKESDSDSQDDISLYEWISAKDTNYSLDALSDYVRDHFDKTDDKELKESSVNLQNVIEFSKNVNYREVRGIEKRLASLEQKLRQLESIFVQIKQIATEIIQPPPGDSAPMRINNIVADQRGNLTRMMSCFNDFSHFAKLFIDSKVELLKNMHQRFAVWVRKAYDFLHQANKNLIVFEDKYNGLVQRLSLVRQIKEAPVIYMTAVAEVIRRSALHKEFTGWMTTHVEKCGSFIHEENKLRSSFYDKLKKHFLHQLFIGLSDQVPKFCSEHPQFDTNLPNVSTDYLRQLRSTFGNMGNLLDVSMPQVYSRLSITDPNAPISVQMPRDSLRREESFFIRDRERPTSIDAFHNNFPSSAWLSDENMDLSPSATSNTLLMARPGFCSTTSLNIDNSMIGTPASLHQFASFDSQKDDYPSSPTPLVVSMRGTPPMNIPTRGGRMDDSKQYSPRSSQFSTPEEGAFESIVKYSKSPLQHFSPRILRRLRNKDHFPTHQLEQFQLPSAKELPTELVAGIRNAKEQLIEFANSLLEIRQSVNDFKSGVKQDQSKSSEEVRQAISDLEAAYLSIVEEHNKSLDDANEKAKKAEDESTELRKVVEHEKYLRREKEKELDELKRLAEKQNNDLLEIMKAKDDLHADILKLETEKNNLEEKLSSIDSSQDCLSIEMTFLEQILNRSLDPEEVERVKSEIEKRKMVKSTSDSIESVSTDKQMRSEYERAYKNKMQLLINGIEEKKNKELAKLREDIETDIRQENDRFVNSMKTRMFELEEKLKFYENWEASMKSPASTSRLSESMISSPSVMQESCMVLKGAPETAIEADETLGDETDKEEKSAHHKDTGDEDTEDDIASLPVNTAAVQTRIRMKDMRMMISLRDVHEGCSVLVMWDNTHNSYMVFCTNQTLHFVKESGIRRLGIDPNGTPRRHWMFAIVTQLEMCQIKKENNRYNLPLHTRFFRVDVKPLPLDSSSTHRRM